MTANTVHALYALALAAMCGLVYASPSFDLRGLGRVRRRKRRASPDEDAYEEAAAPRARRAAREALEIVPRGDAVLLAVLLGLAALALGAGLGWVGPLGVEAAFATPRTADDAPLAAALPLGRLAQVVGAFAGALIALRLLRLFVGLALLGLAVLATAATADYVLDRALLASLGLGG